VSDTITTKQRFVLQGLKEIDGSPSARKLADALETPRFRSARFTYDETYSQLRRLEAKNFVRRVNVGRVLKWQTTEAGRKMLELTES
jgi:Fe2+ or Zn2+ uptake regulation protein